MITATEATTKTRYYRAKRINGFLEKATEAILMAIEDGRFSTTSFIDAKYSYLVDPITTKLEKNGYSVEKLSVLETEDTIDGTKLKITWATSN